MAFIEINNQDENIVDSVETEFNSLNDEITSLTDGNAKVVFSEMSEEEVKTYFKSAKQECYFIDLKYSLLKDGKSHRFRNRCACVSYNATLPAVAKNLLADNPEETICETKEDLQAFIKQVVNAKSFHRSLHRAGWRTN